MIKKILIVLDDDSNEELALDKGFTLAVQHNAATAVIVVSSQAKAWKESLGEFVKDELIYSYLFERRQQVVKSHAQIYGIDNPEVILRSGTSFIEVIQTALAVSADLIVQASHLEDESTLFFTSADWHLMRKSPIPVLVVKEGSPIEPMHILVAVDVTSSQDSFNKDLLRMATSLASVNDAKLTILTAWTLAGELSVRDNPWFGTDNIELDAAVEAARVSAEANLAVLRKWLESHNLSANSWVVTKGVARDVVPTAVIELGVDLIVMGTVGRTGIQGLLIGNTAETVLSKVNCSVVTLKPDTFISPAVPPSQ